ncbi:Sodium/hydrogen exchanger family-domain-containing protein [Blastocladiella britannica]|nr:Sodium/hydrogen exchanger family-domain-containing protein [Blastocladiella britannica]
MKIQRMDPHPLPSAPQTIQSPRTRPSSPSFFNPLQIPTHPLFAFVFSSRSNHTTSNNKKEEMPAETVSAPVKHIAEGTTIWSGNNPFDATQPVALFLLQVIIVVSFARIIGVVLRKFNQPRVIAEVIGGIILGPSVMGLIPHFSTTIFPTTSLPLLNIAAQFGLILYLFLVGVELDPSLLKANARQSISISVAGILLPFGAGSAVAFAMYETLMPADTTVPFGSFLLFLGVAMSITAFPVLARILTENHLLQTKVGMATISAAAVDDFVAWCLLGLVISIINASSGITALYTFLVMIGYFALLVLVVRPMLLKLVLWSEGSRARSEMAIVVTFLLVFISATFTQIIGIDAIFGAFLVGLIVPHEQGFALAMTEKVEDLVTIVLLPLYFALSGLKTQLGLLDSWLVWGMTALVVFVACAGKIIGCTLAARYSGGISSWRDALSVGTLMNTKGLVELIVLNLGLNAGVISPRVFVVMTLMAVITTVMTSPLIRWLNPDLINEAKRQFEQGSAHVPHSIETAAPRRPDEAADETDAKSFKVAVTLDQFDQVPALMSILQSLRAAPGTPQGSSGGVLSPFEKPTSPSAMVTSAAGGSDVELAVQRPLSLLAIRIVDYGERHSEWLRLADPKDTLRRDPLVGIVSTYATLNRIPIRSVLSPSEESGFGRRIAAEARALGSDMVVVPYSATRASATVAAQVLSLAPTVGVSVFMDRGIAGHVRGDGTVKFGSAIRKTQTAAFFIFFGGADDRNAVPLFVRIAESLQFAEVIAIRVRYGEAENKIDAAKVAAEAAKDKRRSVVALGKEQLRKLTGHGDPAAAEAAIPPVPTLDAAATSPAIGPASSDSDDVETAPPARESQPSPIPLVKTFTTRSVGGTKSGKAPVSPDDASFAFLTTRLNRLAARGQLQVTVETYESPAPHGLAARLASDLEPTDLLVTGHRHPLLAVLVNAARIFPEGGDVGAAVEGGTVGQVGMTTGSPGVELQGATSSVTGAITAAARRVGGRSSATRELSDIDLLTASAGLLEPADASMSATEEANMAANANTTRSVFSTVGSRLTGALARAGSSTQFNAADMPAAHPASAATWSAGTGSAQAGSSIAATASSSNADTVTAMGTLGAFLSHRGVQASMLVLRGVDTSSADE